MALTVALLVRVLPALALATRDSCLSFTICAAAQGKQVVRLKGGCPSGV